MQSVYDLGITLSGDSSASFMSSLLSNFSYTLTAPAPDAKPDPCSTYYSNIASAQAEGMKAYDVAVNTTSSAYVFHSEVALAYNTYSQSFEVHTPDIKFNIGFPKNGVANAATSTSLSVHISPMDFCVTGCLNTARISLLLQVNDSAMEIRSMQSQISKGIPAPLAFLNSTVNNNVALRGGVVGTFNTVWASFSETINAAFGTNKYSPTHTSHENRINSAGFSVYRRHLLRNVDEGLGGFLRRIMADTSSQDSYITLDNVFLIGGAPGNSSAFIPCVISQICPPITAVAQRNGTYQYTLQLDFTLDLSALPVDVTFGLNSGFEVSLLCCEFSSLGSVTISPISITPSIKSYTAYITIALTDVTLLNYALNEIGTEDLHFRITGSPTYNLFTSLFTQYQYLIVVPPTPVQPPSAVPSNPAWFLPLNNAGSYGNGTWKLLSSTANQVDITIDVPLSYPLPNQLTIRQVFIDVYYKGVRVLHAFPSTPGDPSGSLILRPSSDPNKLQLTMQVLVNAHDPNCPTNIPILSPDRCSLGSFLQSLIARDQTDLSIILTLNSTAKHDAVTVSLDVELFRDFWLQTFPRNVEAFEKSQFSIFKSPTSSAFIVNGLGSAESSITSGTLNVQFAIDMVNPFAFDFYVNKVGIDAVMDDLDGSHPVVFSSYLNFAVPSLGPIVEDILFQRQVLDMGNLYVPHGKNGVHQQVTTPSVSLKINGGTESLTNIATRAYDAYVKNFMCMHILNGYVDLTLRAPQSSVGFSYRQPFNVPNISAFGDFDCQGTLSCIPAAHNALSFSSTFSTSTWSLQGANSGSLPFINGGVLTLMRINKATVSAWYKTRMNVMKSWIVNFRYTETFDKSVLGIGCYISYFCDASYRGYGFAFVIQDASATVVGTPAAPVDFKSYTHGFNGISNSVGVIFDMADRHEVVIAQNGDGSTACVSPYATGCVNGYHARTDLESNRGPWYTDLSGTHSVRIVYTAASKLLYVFLTDGGGTYRQLTYAYVDISASVKSSSSGSAWMGFVGSSSSDSSYFTQVQLNSFDFGYISTDVHSSYIVQNGFVVASANAPGSFDIDAKDNCVYDRESGGDMWVVHLQNNITPSLIYNTTISDPNTGIYHVAFHPIPMGTYNVLATVNAGPQGILGTIKVREADQ